MSLPGLWCFKSPSITRCATAEFRHKALQELANQKLAQGSSTTGHVPRPAVVAHRVTEHGGSECREDGVWRVSRTTRLLWRSLGRPGSKVRSALGIPHISHFSGMQLHRGVCSLLCPRASRTSLWHGRIHRKRPRRQAWMSTGPERNKSNAEPKSPSATQGDGAHLMQEHPSSQPLHAR